MLVVAMLSVVMVRTETFETLYAVLQFLTVIVVHFSLAQTFP
jgi:hypothetical protein